MPPKAKSASSKDSTANLGFEAKLWLAADKLRNNMDAAETSGASKTAAGSPKGERGGAHQYKHVVLGLIFLKYISDTFEEHRAKLLAGQGEYAGANAEDPDEPSGARKTAAGSPEGERGGVHQFYTPSCVVRCLVEMLAPYKGRIYDPACGSGGMFVQSIKFLESHGGTAPRDSALPESEATLRSLSAAKGNRGDISIYGQDKWARRQRPFGLATRARRVRLRGQQPKQSNATTRRLAIMNLAIRGIEADIGKEHADTFRRDLSANPFAFN